MEFKIESSMDQDHTASKSASGLDTESLLFWNVFSYSTEHKYIKK